LTITARTRFHMAVTAAATIVAAAVGYFSWGSSTGLYALAALPVLWWMLPNRTAALASIGAYYVAALLPVATTILGYYPNWPPIAGWGVLVVVALINATPWLIGWASVYAHPLRRTLGLLLAISISTLPPLGVATWANPLLAAGWIFPAGGWLALAVLLLLWCLVAWRPAASSAGMALVAGAAVAVATNMPYRPPAPPVDLVGINTQLQGASTFLAFSQKLGGIDAVLRQRNLRPGQVAILPETTLDEFKESTATMVGFALGRHLTRGPILSGTTFHQEGSKWAGAVLLGRGGDPVFFRARQPLLFALWHPWDPEDHYSADWLAPNVFSLGPLRVALRICSEDFALYWTLYDFATSRPTVLVSLSNHWWTRDPRVDVAQAQHLQAAARLFDVPVVRAENSAPTKSSSGAPALEP